MRSGFILLIALLLVGLAATPVAAQNLSEEVPPSDMDGPGMVVRQITLDKGDAVDWSWESSAPLGFDVTVSDDGTSVVDRDERTSLAGHFRADRAGTYVFEWSNDDPGTAVELDLTVNVVQTNAYVLGITSVALIAIFAIVYGIVVWRRMVRSGESSEPDMDDYLAGRHDARHAKLERVAMFATLAALVAISVVALVSTMSEGPTLQ
jgi:hypothetical protein